MLNANWRFNICKRLLLGEKNGFPMSFVPLHFANARAFVSERVRFGVRKLMFRDAKDRVSGGESLCFAGERSIVCKPEAGKNGLTRKNWRCK